MTYTTHGHYIPSSINLGEVIHSTIPCGFLDTCGRCKSEVDEYYKNTEVEVCEVTVKHDEHTSVNHPTHYNSHPSGVECIEIVRHMGFNLGNVIKYIWRDGLKANDVPIEDLEKAMFYLKDEIEVRKARSDLNE